MAQFAHLLRGARENAGLTQKELASAVGIDDSYISRIERGSPPPARDKVLAIATELGISGASERAYFLLAAGCANVEDLEGVSQENGQEEEEEELPLIFAGGSLHFPQLPQPKKLEEDALVEELRALLDLAAARTEKWEEVVGLLRSFFAWVRFKLGEKK